MKLQGLTLFLLSTSLLSTHVLAVEDIPPSDAPSWVMLNADGRFDQWQGVGHLNAEQRCTASLIDTRDEHSDAEADAPAYLLTSGHCVDNVAGRVVIDQPAEGDVTFNYFSDTVEQHKTYPLKTVAFSSQQGKDLAIIELDASLQTLIDAGIAPLRIADAAVDEGGLLLSVGAPLVDEAYTLRMATCPMLGTAELVERPYVQYGQIRFACQDIFKGSSGGPLMSAESGEIVGVSGTSTATADASEQCNRDAPCEIVEGQAQWNDATHYASSTLGLNACFSAGRFDPAREHCDLAPAFTVDLGEEDYRRSQYAVLTPGEPLEWDVSFSIDTRHYWYKTARSPAQCLDSKGYGDAQAGGATRIQTPMGDEPGLYLLCVIGANLPDQSVSHGVLKNAFHFATRVVDAETPLPTAELSVTPGEGLRQVVVLDFKRPERVRYEFKIGTPDDIDCEDPEGYREMFAAVIRIGAKRLPAKLCTRAFDEAGRASPLRADVIPSHPDA